MKLTKKQKEIMKQDIEDLEYLVKKYSEEKKFAKASECLKEMKEIQSKLRGESNDYREAKTI